MYETIGIVICILTIILSVLVFVHGIVMLNDYDIDSSETNNQQKFPTYLYGSTQLFNFIKRYFSNIFDTDIQCMWITLFCYLIGGIIFGIVNIYIWLITTLVVVWFICN